MPHVDSDPNEEQVDEGIEVLEKGGKRLMTFMVYLR